MTASSLFAFFSRPASLIATFALLLAVNAPASAQTTIRMTTTQGQPCVAVTDANGLTLIPGSTDLQATGVTLTGAGCGGGDSTPTSPNGLALVATPAAPTAGVAFSVAWQVSNASSCIGTVTSGSAGNVSGWTQVNSPTSPRSVTISAAGLYTLTLTCSNGANPVTLTSPPLQLVVGGGGATCTVPGHPELSQITSSDINYGAYPTPVRTGVDVREYDNIWGHFNATDALVPWPGRNGSGPNIKNFQRTSFLAAHFHTGTDTTRFGFWTAPYTSFLAMDMTVSTTCGDFTAAPSGCIATNVAAPGNTMVSWTFATNNQTKCILQPNTDYWVNVKYHDPNSNAGCAVGVTNCVLPTLIQLDR